MHLMDRLILRQDRLPPAGVYSLQPDIRENLLFERRDATEAQIKEAWQNAGR